MEPGRAGASRPVYLHPRVTPPPPKKTKCKQNQERGKNTARFRRAERRPPTLLLV